MKLSLQWLREWVDFDLSPQQLAEKLTYAGLEVEAIHAIGAIPESVVMVRIDAMEKHPQADRLTLCAVSLGDETRQIVCGAKNMKVGDVVALATPGTLLPDGKKIEKSKIRGIESAGMLCSESELGLTAESSGLLILPPELPLGRPLRSVLALEDTVLEINVTPNRADCLSVLGLAREVSALTGQPLKTVILQPKQLEAIAQPASFEVSISAESTQACPIYWAAEVYNVQVAPSKFAIQQRLRNVGIRSINNVVDATNYVLIELGHPLHAFDAQKLSGKAIQVRYARSGETFTTLDQAERILTSQDLVIADTHKPLALAGILGGFDSGITAQTQQILLESAYFNPIGIRKTAKRLGIQTDASYRFERGVDPQGLPLALNRLLQLLGDWAGAKAVGLSQKGDPKSFSSPKLVVRPSRVRRVLGADFSATSIQSVLERLQCKPQSIAEDQIECVIPTYRIDLNREIDLIEEIARVQGYDKVPTTSLQGTLKPSTLPQDRGLEKRVKSYLNDVGFQESIHYSFISQNLLDRCQLKSDNQLELSNPLSEDLAVLRPSLIPNLLETFKRNCDRQHSNLRLFELRSIYKKAEDQTLQERKSLALLMSGDRFLKHWAFSKNQKVDFYDLKGILEGLWKTFHWPTFAVKASQNGFFHPGMAGEMIVNGQSIGNFGVLHPQIIASFESEIPLVVAELDWQSLGSLPTNQSLKALPKFPWVERDLTAVVSESFLVESILEVTSQLQIPSLQSVDLIDIYRGQPIENGKKALTYSIRYQNLEQTLTDEEVNKNHQVLLDTLRTRLAIEWR